MSCLLAMFWWCFYFELPPTSVLLCPSRKLHIYFLAQGSVLWYYKKPLHVSFDLNCSGFKNASKHGSRLLFSLPPPRPQSVFYLIWITKVALLMLIGVKLHCTFSPVPSLCLTATSSSLGRLVASSSSIIELDLQLFHLTCLQFSTVTQRCLLEPLEEAQLKYLVWIIADQN
jgi:hypothetical protein